MDEGQKNRFEIFANQVSEVVLLDEIASYDLGILSGYQVVQVSAMTGMRDIKEIIRFLSAGLRYVCMRVEGSPFIWFTNEGDANDLWLDFYERVGSPSFLKDMLTMKERYEMVFNSSSYWNKHQALTLMYTDGFDAEATLVDLNEHTQELFCPDDELVILDEQSGEAHDVNLTLGIPENYFTIVVPKKLENDKQNIL
jgi:hypothetical protein